MARNYFVQNKQTREILNQAGGWSRNTRSYRLAAFESAEAATLAFPEGVECVVLSEKRQEVGS